MSILFLTNNLAITKPLYDWLCEIEEPQPIRIWDASLTANLFFGDLQDVDLMVSYNYRHIIKKEVISLFPGRIINLHISMLPWNRGAGPNLWSFINDTPKGVTIHRVDEGLDTGDILLQKQIFFDEQRETLASSYARLHAEIQSLFRKNWADIKSGSIKPTKQGSCHTQKETNTLMHKYNIHWDDLISDVKAKILLFGTGGGHTPTH